MADERPWVTDRRRRWTSLSEISTIVRYLRQPPSTVAWIIKDRASALPARTARPLHADLRAEQALWILLADSICSVTNFAIAIVTKILGDSTQSHTSIMAMFIRVKRKKTTYFLHCDPSETVVETKHKLHALSDVPVDQQRLILLPAHSVLDDNRTLADQKVENDAVVALTLKIVETGDWEEVCIDKPADHANLIDPELS